MQTEKRKWTPERGWEDLNGMRLGKNAQLVVAIGTRSDKDREELIEEIKEFYPNARVVFNNPMSGLLNRRHINRLNLTAFEFEFTRQNYSRLYL